jgi:hypothetical protein
MPQPLAVGLLPDTHTPCPFALCALPPPSLTPYPHTAGMSWLFNDRQFLCRALGVAFPDGTRALAVYSPPDGTHPADPGVTKARTIRAHMGVSGYVVSPYAGECVVGGSAGCAVSVVGWGQQRWTCSSRVHMQGRPLQWWPVWTWFLTPVSLAVLFECEQH